MSDLNTSSPEPTPDAPRPPANLFGLPWRRHAGLAVDEAWWRHRLFVTLAACLLLLPFLGSFGLWDPWETHYGEVGRQITERHDWISTWWGSHWQDAGGSQEGAYFFSKPILLMWMMAMGLEVFGYNEFAIRIGVAIVAILGIVLAFSMGASVFRRRTGWLMAGVLATSPFWAMLSRQAQTDMPFVGLMTVGLCFFMMGIFGRDREEPADKLAYLLTFGWLGLVSIPQITLILAGLSRWRGAANPVMEFVTNPPTRGVIAMGVLMGAAALVWLVALVGVSLARTWWRREDSDASARKPARIVLTGLALASLGVLWVPLLVLLVAVLATSSNLPVDLAGWFAWGGVQSSLYLTCLGAGVYWTVSRPIVEKRRIYLLNFYVFIGLATLAKGLLGFMLPGAILFFYILLTREWRTLKDVELLRGVPIFIAVTFPWYAAMLVRHNPGFWNRFFIHDHFKRLASGVHQLDTGSFEFFIRWLGYGLFPWAAFVPAALGRIFAGEGLSKNDDRARATLMLILWATIAFTLFTLSSTKFHHYIFPVVPPLAMLVALGFDDVLDRELPHPWPLYLLAIPLLALLTWDLVDSPQHLKNLFTYKYDREWDNAAWDRGFRMALLGIAAPIVAGASLMLMRNRAVRRVSVGLVAAGAVAMTYFSLDVYMPTISQTWSQKGVWDHYYGHCERVDGPPGAHPPKRYCGEPVIAYKLNWRGETFYSQNEVIPIRDDDDFTHVVNGVGAETFYGIMEYSRYRGEFQRELPARFKGKACVVFNGNLKFVLAKVPCRPDDPERLEVEEPDAVRR